MSTQIFSNKNNNCVNSNSTLPFQPTTNGSQVLAPTLLNYFTTCESLPRLPHVPVSERHNMFIQKLNMCAVLFDFTDPTMNLNEKDMKRRILVELLDYVATVNSKFSEVDMQAITKTLSANLFRDLPPSIHISKLSDDIYDPKDDKPTVDPSWPHLEIVYKLLLRFVSSPETDSKLANRYIDHAFVLRLLELFDSEDPTERDILKTILHRVYGRFMVHRPFIRKAINNIFYQFVFETKRHNGIAELLVIVGSIINGFELPLKEEHKPLLTRALIPLHKPKGIRVYHEQLSYCIAQFLEKDVKLADTVIRGLLKYWPVTNSSKEVMFISELEEVLEATQPAEFQRCMVPLFRQIGSCVNSSHFQVAERALFLWNNDHIRNLIILNQKVILPIILPSLEKTARGHWKQAVQSLALNVRKVFSDADPSFFDECLAKFQNEEIKEKETPERREPIWKRLEDITDVRNEAVLVSLFPSSVAIATSNNS